jgi:crotonobetainyl-CoA:carnitine CoA-transferase CaiB-like acyl-CoA transferase
MRILDLTRLIPGGVCTLILAEMGADVIKIEDPLDGDYMRWMPPAVNDQGVFFTLYNRNKRSAIINLKHEQGQVVFKHLVLGADAVIEGFRPDVMTRLGCDYPTLKTINPRLVYCSLSGWGAHGPYIHRSGHDVNYTSIAGMNGAMNTPQVMGGQMADVGGAYMAAAGVVAGLLNVQRTGQGTFVDVSLFESVLPFAAYGWVEAVTQGVTGPGSLTGGEACYNIYKTRDEKAVSLAALEPKFWANFCNAISRPDLIPNYLLPDRQKYLRLELAEIFALKSADEWLSQLKDADCCFALVNAPNMLHHDPHVQARGDIGLDVEGAPWLRSPIRMDDDPYTLNPAPYYGEHTRAVLLEAGFNDAQIDDLIAVGAIKG